MARTTTKLPANPAGLYWTYWAPYKRLVDWSTSINVLFLFQARPVGGAPGTTGAVYYNAPAGSPGTNLNADITTCRARGQLVILTTGGAFEQISLETQPRADAFIQSIKDINVQLGGSGTAAVIDGIDFNNFEGVTEDSIQAVWMTYIGQQLKAYYGSDFIISAPPSCTDFDGSMTANRFLLARMYAGDALDWFCPQFYDGDGNNTEAQINTALNFYNTAVTIDGVSVTIPRNLIGIGYRIDPTYEFGWTAANAAAAYTDAVADGNEPKGSMNFSSELDTGESYASTVIPVMTNNADVPIDTPAFTLKLSSNFTDEAATTAQLTPPTGKTTGDFQAGAISEATNPLSAIDLASGKYTELEWCIEATADAEDAAQYEFRVTYNGNSLDTYSVTPKLTVGTPVPPVAETPKTSAISSYTGISKLTL